MYRLFLSCLIALMFAVPIQAVDTDGDGLLDLMDVPEFDPQATGDVVFESRRIKDLDGASLLTNAIGLHVVSNRITSIEPGDFQGLGNLQTLSLGAN